MRLNDFYRRIKVLEAYGHNFSDEETKALFLVASRHEIDRILTGIEDELQLRRRLSYPRPS